jgi:hypothetical protein
MKRTLLYIEWLKVRRYATFWVLMGLYTLLLPFLNYEISNGTIRLGGGGKNGPNLLNTAYTFPEVWSNLGYWGSIFIIFPGILVIILVTNEFGYRTGRQNLIDGWSRLQGLHAKAIMALTLSAYTTLHMWLMGIAFGGHYSGSLDKLSEQLQPLGAYFVLSINYLGFAMLLGFLVRRSGLAVGLYILYALILEYIIKSVVNSYIDTPWGNLLPLQCSDELLPFPIIMMTKALMQQANKISDQTYVLASLGWCAIYYGSSRMLLQKRDW